jgi:Mrp family chromosome partitioning ATPase
LAIPLGLEVIDVFAQRPPQRALPEQDYLRQALFLDRPDPAFRVGIQIAAADRQRENIIAVGNSGTGKSHIALGIGLAACRKGLSVGFITANGLLLGR